MSLQHRLQHFLHRPGHDGRSLPSAGAVRHPGHDVGRLRNGPRHRLPQVQDANARVGLLVKENRVLVL